MSIQRVIIQSNVLRKKFKMQVGWTWISYYGSETASGWRWSTVMLWSKKCIVRYNTMTKSHSNALMGSAFHCFGSQHNPGTVTCVQLQGGGIWRGRWIPVQATASGRWKYGLKGKTNAVPGRPLAGKTKKIRNLVIFDIICQYDLSQRENTYTI